MAYPKIVARVRDTVALAAREKPDVAILIDSWGFTLRVAHGLRRLDPKLPLIKYVGPQVWATRPGRAKTLAKAVDHLLSIHAFDAPLFEAEGAAGDLRQQLRALAWTSVARPSPPTACARTSPPSPGGPLILIVLPGSRPGEIERVLPAFADAVNILKAERPNLQVVVPAAPTVADLVKARVAGWPHRAHVVEGDQGKLDAMKAATVALACSGTVTTELALAGVPMVVGYRLGPLTHAILKRLIRTPYITLFNVAAQAFVAPELVQDECTGPKLAKEVALRLDDAGLRERQVAEQYAALDRMGRGGPDPSVAAADAVAQALGGD